MDFRKSRLEQLGLMISKILNSSTQVGSSKNLAKKVCMCTNNNFSVVRVSYRFFVGGWGESIINNLVCSVWSIYIAPRGVRGACFLRKCFLI